MHVGLEAEVEAEVTEAMTAGRALVLVGSIGGNESVNESIVLAQGAGVHAEPHRVGAAIASMRG